MICEPFHGLPGWLALSSLVIANGNFAFAFFSGNICLSCNRPSNGYRGIVHQVSTLHLHMIWGNSPTISHFSMEDSAGFTLGQVEESTCFTLC